MKPRRLGMRRLGSAWRWGWALGSALLCVYIAFDVLDLDGSQLQQRSGVAITAETSSAEADRLLRESASAPPVLLHPRALATDIGLRLHLAGTRLRPLRDGSFLPRRHLSRLGSRVSEQSADPA